MSSMKVGSIVLIALCTFFSRPADADTFDDRVLSLAQDLLGPSLESAQACKDLDTIRATFGPQKIEPAIPNLLVIAYKNDGGCSDHLLKAIPMDDNATDLYFTTVESGGNGALEALIHFERIGYSAAQTTQLLQHVGSDKGCASYPLLLALLNQRQADLIHDPNAIIVSRNVATHISLCTDIQVDPLWNPQRRETHGKSYLMLRLVQLLALNGIEGVKDYASAAPSLQMDAQAWYLQTLKLYASCTKQRSASDQADLDSLIRASFPMATSMAQQPPPAPRVGGWWIYTFPVYSMIASCNLSTKAQIDAWIAPYRGSGNLDTRMEANRPYPPCQCNLYF